MPYAFPRSLAALAKLAAKENPRYAVTALRITGNALSYRVDVTDGRCALIARGNYAAPSWMEVPEGERAECLVPAQDWTAGFKIGGRSAKHEPVGFSATGPFGLFASTDQQHSATLEEGRFPNVDEVYPKRPAFVQCDVNPEALGKLLLAMAAVQGQEHQRVTLLWYGQGKPFGIMGTNGEVWLDGMMMPLT